MKYKLQINLKCRLHILKIHCYRHNFVEHRNVISDLHIYTGLCEDIPSQWHGELEYETWFDRYTTGSQENSLYIYRDRTTIKEGSSAQSPSQSKCWF